MWVRQNNGFSKIHSGDQDNGMAAQLLKTGENGRSACNIDRMDLWLVLLRSQRRAGDFLYEEKNLEAEIPGSGL